MSKVILFGNSADASVLYSYLSETIDFEVFAFTIDRKFIKEETLFDLPVIPFDEVAAK
ncbi:hypothetical protein ACFLUA_03360 [Chloroflexota bacterium]